MGLLSALQPLTDVEIVAIVTFRATFEGSIEKARQALAECDWGVPLGTTPS